MNDGAKANVGAALLAGPCFFFIMFAILDRAHPQDWKIWVGLTIATLVISALSLRRSWVSVCSACGTQNSSSAEMCGSCGRRLGSVCPRCGTSLGIDAYRCSECGLERT